MHSILTLDNANASEVRPVICKSILMLWYLFSNIHSHLAETVTSTIIPRMQAGLVLLECKIEDHSDDTTKKIAIFLIK